MIVTHLSRWGAGCVVLQQQNIIKEMSDGEKEPAFGSHCVVVATCGPLPRDYTETASSYSFHQAGLLY